MSGKMGPMADPADNDHHLPHLVEAGQRLVRSVDRLSGDDWEAPSLLPDWSRAHVAAHLALNGEGLTGVLRGEVDRESVPMYESQEARDDDIAELAAADPSEIRERLLASTVTFPEAVQAVPSDLWQGRFERTRGGSTLPLRAAPVMRAREIEIHHVDLDVGYSVDAWPRLFAEELVDGMAKRVTPEEGFVLRSPGDDAAVVTGPVAHVAWWLTGRTPSEQVSCSRGELPQIGGW